MYALTDKSDCRSRITKLDWLAHMYAFVSVEDKICISWRHLFICTHDSFFSPMLDALASRINVHQTLSVRSVSSELAGLIDIIALE